MTMILKTVDGVMGSLRRMYILLNYDSCLLNFDIICVPFSQMNLVGPSIIVVANHGVGARATI